jgi:hypothetical protein
MEVQPDSALDPSSELLPHSLGSIVIEPMGWEGFNLYLVLSFLSLAIAVRGDVWVDVNVVSGASATPAPNMYCSRSFNACLLLS